MMNDDYHNYLIMMSMTILFQVQTHSEDRVAFAKMSDKSKDNDDYHHHLMMILITRLSDESKDNDDKDDKNNNDVR